MIATGESDTRKVMELADKNDAELKKSIASVVELLGSSIATLKADTDQKIREIQTAVQQLHDKATAPAAQQRRHNNHQTYRRDLTSARNLRH